MPVAFDSIAAVGGCHGIADQKPAWGVPTQWDSMRPVAERRTRGLAFGGNGKYASRRAGIPIIRRYARSTSKTLLILSISWNFTSMISFELVRTIRPQ